MKEFRIGQNVFFINNDRISSGRILNGIGEIIGDGFRFNVCNLPHGTTQLLDSEIFYSYEEAIVELSK